MGSHPGMAPSWLSQAPHTHPQDLQSCGPPVTLGSGCWADARTGTEAPPPRAWLAILEGDPGWWPFLSPRVEQLSGSH